MLSENINKFKLMSANRLLILVTLYIVIVNNNTLWSTFWTALGENPQSHLFFVISFVMFIMVMTLMLLSLFSFTHIIKPVAIIALMSSSIVAYYIDNMHVIFSVSMMQNVFETNAREASDLFNLAILTQVTIFGVLPSILVWLVKINRKTVPAEFISRIKLLSVSLLVVALTIFWTYKEYTLVLRENRELSYMVNPVFPVVSLVKYGRSLNKEKNRSVAPVFNDASRYSIVKNDQKKNLLIMVVGETARAENFSLNGYARETNPQLKKLDIINYPNTSSCGTATAKSVPCMFSDLTKNDFSVSDAKQRENLLDGFSNAGISVLWRDNNSSCKGVCARVESESLLDFKVEDLCNEDGCRDEILLYKLDEYVNSLDNDTVIVLHQMGSHGPAYYKRYPAEFEKFTPACDVSSVHNCKQQEIVNAYDNTILYTDYFLSKVIDYLKVRSDRFNTAMIYMSDHGESLGENGIYLHGLPNFMAPHQQTHVPFIVWLSDSIRHQNQVDIACLKDNSQHPYSHDNLVHSALGLMNVSTAVYEQSKDVFAACSKSKIATRSSPLKSGSS